MKPVNNGSFYDGFSTYSHWIQSAFPSPDHQKDGPVSCLPLWHIKSRTNHEHDCKVDPRRLSKWTLKLINMDIWISRCLLRPLHPWITKMVTQGTQNGASRSPNSLGYKKSPISAGNQSAVACWQGAGGRGEALRSKYKIIDHQHYEMISRPIRSYQFVQHVQEARKSLTMCIFHHKFKQVINV